MHSEPLFARGSEWRQWDLHIHSPASFHWNGAKFKGMSATEKKQAVDEMIQALNNAEPTVFALMDYWTFDGWFALKERLKEKGAPVLTKLVLPGIELRLVSPTDCRLNAHVIFSNKIKDQALQDFRSALQVELISRPLSDQSLIDLVRKKVAADMLQKHGFKKAETDVDDNLALLAGATIAEITASSYKDAIEKVPDGQAIGFMPYDTNDGLEEVKWQKHYSYFMGLFKTSPIFETRNTDLRNAFVGVKTDGNAKWFDAFWTDLESIPRLAVSGSDAHRFSDYGKFPLGKVTWIKADPTFFGLQQAIREAARRSYIGDKPPKLEEVAQNKTFYINSITVTKNVGSKISEKWLASCSLPLNPELVAVIGNKGSGKSALADVLALLGNSTSSAHFSFLSRDRFRQQPAVLAQHFTGTLAWCAGTPTERLLSENAPSEAPELVRYIPQAYFEDLCNAHVSGGSDKFENELRAVIFAHSSPSLRQSALSFDQLIEREEKGHREQLAESRKDLKKINHEIARIEKELNPGEKNKLTELLVLKQQQIAEHKKIEPKPQAKPADQLTPEQLKAAEELDRITIRINEIDKENKALFQRDANASAKAKAILNIRERIRLLNRQYKQFETESAADMEVLGLKVDDVASLSTNEAPLDKAMADVAAENLLLVSAKASIGKERETLAAEQVKLKAQLNEPQRQYQEALNSIAQWQGKLKELTGDPNSPDSLEGLRTRLAQLAALPQQLAASREKRLALAAEIFDSLEAQRVTREVLFQPVQEVIQSNNLIRDQYKLQFRAALNVSSDSLAASLFSLIKQNSGEFRGEPESREAIKKIVEQHTWETKAGALSMLTTLHDKIADAAQGNNKNVVGIDSMVRVNRTSSEVYDLLFGLEFMEPRYTLRFQDTQIEHLSPGQRGALLLIFYLLVDKGHNPIILDQPEENLDNETVVSLLVPVLSEAKKRRQIIMVTHNPNLAVVCDAEQVIYSGRGRDRGYPLPPAQIPASGISAQGSCLG